MLRVTRDDSRDSPDSASTSSFGSPMSANVTPNPPRVGDQIDRGPMSRMIVPMLTLHASRSISSVAHRRITVSGSARPFAFVNVPFPV